MLISLRPYCCNTYTLINIYISIHRITPDAILSMTLIMYHIICRNTSMNCKYFIWLFRCRHNIASLSLARHYTGASDRAVDNAASTALCAPYTDVLLCSKGKNYFFRPNRFPAFLHVSKNSSLTTFSLKRLTNSLESSALITGTLRKNFSKLLRL